jgi:hypothetical protein
MPHKYYWIYSKKVYLYNKLVWRCKYRYNFFINLLVKLKNDVLYFFWMEY